MPWPCGRLDTIGFGVAVLKEMTLDDKKHHLGDMPCLSNNNKAQCLSERATYNAYREEHLSAYNACQQEHAYSAYRQKHLTAYNACPKQHLTMRIQRASRLQCLWKGAFLQCISRGASVRFQCLSKGACLQCVSREVLRLQCLSKGAWSAEDNSAEHVSRGREHVLHISPSCT